MARELGPFAMQMLDLRHVAWLEDAAMDDEDVIARRDQLLDGGAPDEARAAQDDDSQGTRRNVRLSLSRPPPSATR